MILEDPSLPLVLPASSQHETASSEAGRLSPRQLAAIAWRSDADEKGTALNGSPHFTRKLPRRYHTYLKPKLSATVLSPRNSLYFCVLNASLMKIGTCTILLGKSLSNLVSSRFLVFKAVKLLLALTTSSSNALLYSLTNKEKGLKVGELQE